MELSSSTPAHGYLDTFKEHGPVLFDGINRTSAIEDVRNILIYISFTTLFVAFLIIFPGIRKERLSTFICVTVSLILGAIILVSNFGTSWHVANANISSPYRAFSKEKIFANIGVCVGLQSVNITLQALPFHVRSEEINYNERFYWIDPTEMKIEHKKALAKGLPFPILTVAEYLSQDGEGFCWGRRYRLAGYYSSVLLWASFITWLLMNVLLCAVPKYGVYLMELTGILMLSTNAIYSILLPKKPLIIPFEKEKLFFEYGWCFWAVLAGGLLAVIIGSILTIIDAIFPNKFSTILEIDYDTPYRYFVNASNDPPSSAASTHMSATVTSSSATESTTCCLHSNGGTVTGKSTSTIKRDSLHSMGADSRVNYDDDDDDYSDRTSTCTACNQSHHHCEACHNQTNLPSLAKFKSDSVIAVENKSPNVDTPGKLPLCKSITTTATIEHTDSLHSNHTSHRHHPHHHHHHHLHPSHHHPYEERGQRRASSISSTYTKSQLKSFTRGVTNDAYLDDESESRESVLSDKKVSQSTDASLDQNNSSSDEITSSSPSISAPAAVSLAADDVDDADGHQSDSSEISTTIIDGKRAISLHNFGKYVAQQSKSAVTSTSSSSAGAGGAVGASQLNSSQQYTQYNRFVSHSSDPSSSRYNIRYHLSSGSSAGAPNSRSIDTNNSHQTKSSHHHRQTNRR